MTGCELETLQSMMSSSTADGISKASGKPPNSYILYSHWYKLPCTQLTADAIPWVLCHSTFLLACF
eukprot:355894-Amphidinium_carterae.1